MDTEVYNWINHDWPNIVLANQFGFLDLTEEELEHVQKIS